VEITKLGLFASETAFAELHALPGKNVGGLIGKWTLSGEYEAQFLNANTITMDYIILNEGESIAAEDYAENVGGVVGYLLIKQGAGADSSIASVSMLKNNGNIEYGNILDINNEIANTNIS